MLAAVVALGAACSDAPTVPAPLSSDSEDAGVPVGDDGACRLITRDEASVAIDAVPGAASTGSRPLLVGMTMCSVEAKRQRQRRGQARAAWGVLSSGGRRRFDQYVSFHRPYVREVEGLGDRAVWDPGLRTVLVVRDDAVLALQVGVVGPPAGSKDKGRASYVRTTGVTLAARMLTRLSR